MLQKSLPVLRFSWETRILQLIVKTKSMLVCHLSQKDFIVLKQYWIFLSMFQSHPLQMHRLVQMGKWAGSIGSVVQGIWSRIRNLRFLILGFLLQFSIRHLLWLYCKHFATSPWSYKLGRFFGSSKQGNLSMEWISTGVWVVWRKISWIGFFSLWNFQIVTIMFVQCVLLVVNLRSVDTSRFLPLVFWFMHLHIYHSTVLVLGLYSRLNDFLMI